MKIAIAYPPLDSSKGCPTIGQNRQFQYFREPTFIFPVVPATAATLLKNDGHEVVWADAIAAGWDQRRFCELLLQERPDLVLIESKTPVIKQHWGWVGRIKEILTGAGRVALCGDHVTALPEESFAQSPVDFVLTGGDYDFLVRDLCRCLDRKQPPQNFRAGIYYRQGTGVKSNGPFVLEPSLAHVPLIDRDLTRWKWYAYENGNYKRRPGAYIMSARDCWWGKCTFCAWPALYPHFRVRTVEQSLDEIAHLCDDYGVREVMDDSGCFPAGEWLDSFTHGVLRRGLERRVYLDCNMRFGALRQEQMRAMRRANFRLLLFGLESANQATLDRIRKNVTVERIIQDCRDARAAGLFPHITVMFGYPWEEYRDALRTLRLAQWLLRKGYAYTMQATIVIPYPGTPLFAECKESGLLTTSDWDDFDMKKPVMKTRFPDSQLNRLVQTLYRTSMHPEFLLRKLLSLRDADDVRYYARAARKVAGHVFDFNRRDCGKCDTTRPCGHS